MRTRTKVLSALAVLAAAVPGTILAFPAEAVGPNLLPVTVTNNTGRSEAVYLYVLGTMNGRMGYVNASGTFQNWSGGSNPPAPAPDAAIAGPGNGGNKTIQIPRGISGRMWMSLGQKLKFFVTPDGLVQPDMVNPTDPNRDILFDSSEFTYNDSGLWLNSTQVDMFAIPHAVTVTGSNGVTKKTGELLNNGRDTVINQIKAQPDFAKSVITRSDGTVLRVLAPSKATAAGFMNASYLDSAINTAWSTYASKTLTVVPFGDQPSIKFFGRTSGSVMNFTNTSGQQVASFQKPSTMDVWNCDGKLLAPNDNVVGPIARTLCAALHRGTLTKFDTQPAGTAADFYKQSASNVYSGIVHSQMADGKAYGFAFDDVQNQESLVHDGDPRAAGIILTPFGAGGPTNPTDPTTPPTTPPTNPSNTKMIVSDWQGKCIDVSNGQFNDGQPLQMWSCDTNTLNQKWEFVNGTIRTQNNKCMDVAWGSKDNGAAIQLANCSGSAAQQFVLSGAGDLVNPQANKCVDIKDWNSANGAALHLWECGGTANQKWHLK